MAHILVVGMTESGKTKLAQSICWQFQMNGIKTAILDPLSDPAWRADYQTRNRYEFLQVVKNSRQIVCVVDEAGESVGKYNDEMFWLATRARHYGHVSIFISQRAQQLSPTVRDQCPNLYMFCVSRKDAKILSEEHNREELERASELKKGEFFRSVKMGSIHKGRIDLATHKVKLWRLNDEPGNNVDDSRSGRGRSVGTGNAEQRRSKDGGETGAENEAGSQIGSAQDGRVDTAE